MVGVEVDGDGVVGVEVAGDEVVGVGVGAAWANAGVNSRPPAVAPATSNRRTGVFLMPMFFLSGFSGKPKNSSGYPES